MKDVVIERRWIVATAACVALLAGGCERRDPATRAINETKNTLLAAGSGGSAAAPAETLQKNYAQAIATIKDDGASEATKAINAAIAANILHGQGGLEAEQFRRADAALLRDMATARAKLGLYIEQQALATALSGYDPKADLAAFDAQIKQREQELADAKKRHEANESRVAGIKARASAKAEEGRAAMQALGSMRAALPEASADDRPALAQRLNEGRRRAERLMKESDLLEAEAAQFAPESTGLALEVNRVEHQIASLNTAKESARGLAESRRSTSAEAARGAEATATELSEAVRAVRASLAEHVKPAYEAALGKLNQAAGKFGQARGGPDQNLLALTGGAAAQSIGALQREYAEVLARVADLLNSAGSVQPAIPGASEFAQAGEETAAESKQILDAAFQQYEKAKSAVRSGGSAELRERVDQLAARINETWVMLGGTPPEEEKLSESPESDEASPAPEAESDVAPDAETPDEETPKEETEPAGEPAGEPPPG